MMDRRQLDDASERAGLPPTKISKPEVIHRHIQPPSTKSLDSRIATIANHGAGLWAGSTGRPSLRQ
jgi:hypothetical protein